MLGCSTMPRGFEAAQEQLLLHRPSGTGFPDRIGAFERNAPVSYNSAGTDVSVNYRLVTPFHANLDMYVYPPSGSLETHHGEYVRTIVASHPGATVESDGPTQISRNGESIDALQATFRHAGVFEGVRRSLYSVLFEFKYKGWFVSYRMDAPADAIGAQGTSDALKLLEEFVKEGPLPAKAY
jgi:hypothetical protein